MYTYDDAFLYVRNAAHGRGDAEITDVLPTVLASMGLPATADLDGSPVNRGEGPEMMRARCPRAFRKPMESLKGYQ